jgi:CubicO group peptidase (beta-lactamase class C family)
LKAIPLKNRCRRTRKHRFGGIGILVLGMLNSGLAQTSFSPAAERVFTRLLADQHVPSASIAQIRGGKIVVVGEYGRQDSVDAANTTTLYNVASLTKPISAEVALRLVSQGTISLDESMDIYWTDPDIARDDRRRLLTPLFSLTHRTGLAANWRSEDGGTLRFSNTPGTSFHYSGEGYEYLARFMQKKTNHDFQEPAEELLLTPAEMAATSYVRRPWFEGRVALPADKDGVWIEPMFTDSPLASDRLYTTAGDYARFLIQVLNNEAITDSLARERRRVQVSLREEIGQSIPVELRPDELGMGLGASRTKITPDEDAESGHGHLGPTVHVAMAETRGKGIG